MLANSRSKSSFVSGTDSLVALFIAVAATTIANWNRLPDGNLEAFLIIRLTPTKAIFCLVFGVLWYQCFRFSGLYEKKLRSITELVVHTARACAMMTAVLGVYLLSFHRGGPVKVTLELFFLFSFLYEAGRVWFGNVHMHRLMKEPERVIILGTGRRAQKAWRELRVHHHKTASLLGFVDEFRFSEVAPDIAARQVCTIDQLGKYFYANSVDTLIVAIPLQSCFVLARNAVTLAESFGVRVICMQDTFDLAHGRSWEKKTQSFYELVPRDDFQMFCLFVKSVTDRLLAAFLLLLGTPLIAAVSLLIRLLSGETAFVGTRMGGYRRKSYMMWDFRALSTDSRFKNSEAASDSPLSSSSTRTMHSFALKFDNVLRVSRIKNIPRLWNVLIGEMSILGPEPTLEFGPSLINDPGFMRRFMMRPGIIGTRYLYDLRGANTIDEKIQANEAYVDDWSFALDCKLIGRALIVAISQLVGAIGKNIQESVPPQQDDNRELTHEKVNKTIKIAVVHDYFTQLGGAERVADELFRMLPEASLLSLVALKKATPEALRHIQIKTSWMQFVPGIAKYYRLYFLLYPFAVKSLDLSSFDLVLSSTSGYAKGVRTGGNTVHVCYCHTPMRWVWSFDSYSQREAMGKNTRAGVAGLISVLKIWDVQAARQPDHFIANSQAVATRIFKAYQRTAEIIHPPIDLGRFHLDSEQDDYYLLLSRLVSYKRLDLAVDACTQLKRRLLVIGDGPYRKALMAKAGPTITFCGRLSDKEVNYHAARCRALIFPGEEDFGMAPLEVAASGRPCIAYKAGGSLETIIEGKTGMFFEEQNESHLINAIRKFETQTYSQDVLRQHAEKFSIDVFRENMHNFLLRIGIPAHALSNHQFKREFESPLQPYVTDTSVNWI